MKYVKAIDVLPQEIIEKIYLRKEILKYMKNISKAYL